MPGKASVALSWSLDGTTVAFRGPAGRLVTDDAIFVVSVGGGSARLLTTGYKGAITWVGWSPMGTSLLAAAVEYEASALLKLSLTDTEPVPILPENLRGRGYLEEQLLHSGADASVVAFQLIGVLRELAELCGSTL